MQDLTTATTTQLEKDILDAQKILQEKKEAEKKQQELLKTCEEKLEINKPILDEAAIKEKCKELKQSLLNQIPQVLLKTVFNANTMPTILGFMNCALKYNKDLPLEKYTAAISEVANFIFKLALLLDCKQPEDSVDYMSSNNNSDCVSQMLDILEDNFNTLSAIKSVTYPPTNEVYDVPHLDLDTITTLHEINSDIRCIGLQIQDVKELTNQLFSVENWRIFHAYYHTYNTKLTGSCLILNNTIVAFINYIHKEICKAGISLAAFRNTPIMSDEALEGWFSCFRGELQSYNAKMIKIPEQFRPYNHDSNQFDSVISCLQDITNFYSNKSRVISLQTEASTLKQELEAIKSATKKSPLTIFDNLIEMIKAYTRTVKNKTDWNQPENKELAAIREASKSLYDFYKNNNSTSPIKVHTLLDALMEFITTSTECSLDVVKTVISEVDPTINYKDNKTEVHESNYYLKKNILNDNLYYTLKIFLENPTVCDKLLACKSISICIVQFYVILQKLKDSKNLATGTISELSKDAAWPANLTRKICKNRDLLLLDNDGVDQLTYFGILDEVYIFTAKRYAECITNATTKKN